MAVGLLLMTGTKPARRCNPKREMSRVTLTSIRVTGLPTGVTTTRRAEASPPYRVSMEVTAVLARLVRSAAVRPATEARAPSLAA